MLKLYNTLSRKLQVFKPLNKDEVLMYACGPTVYHYAHIGNLRTYVFEDLLKRTLIYNDFKVKHVINITDVGHLTSDADTGEDKLEKEAKIENKSVWDIALFYTNAFKQDFKKLNLLDPSLWCKATDNIKEQIELVECLEKKGYTYKTSDGIYFDTSKFKNYGKMAKLKISGLKAGARIEVGEKKHPTDFALWKFSPQNQKRQMEWDSSFGAKGFPGWHVECSAMAMKFLGKEIDIHCGGIDHISVHHTNEIAQSEGCLGKKWVNYWVHGDFLVINKEKMAKSGANFLTLQELEKHGYTALDYRYFCLTAHYRTQLNFSFEDLDSARNAYNKLKAKVLEFKTGTETKNKTKKYKTEFLKSINEDLNMPKVLAVVWALVKDEKILPKDKYNLLLDFDTILGLDLDKVKEIEVPVEITKLVEERELARKAKDFLKADELRALISSKGYLIEDTADGIKVKQLKS